MVRYRVRDKIFKKESMSNSRMKRLVVSAAALTVAAVLVVVAFTARDSGDNTVKPSPSSSPTSSSSVSPSPSETDEPLAPELIDSADAIDFSTMKDEYGIEVDGPELTDGFGTYQQIKIPDNSAIYSVGTSGGYPLDLTEAYDESQIEEARKFAVDYIFYGLLDNPASVDASLEYRQQAVDAVLPMVGEEYREEYEKALLDETSYNLLSPLTYSYSRGYSAVYEEGRPRFALTMFDQGEKPDASLGDGIIAFYYDLEVQAPGKSFDDGKLYQLVAGYSVAVAVSVSDDGDYKVVGWTYANFYSNVE